VKEVKEKQIHRGERTEDAADHQVEQDVKLLHAVRDVVRAAGRREGHNRAHQNNADVDAVGGQVKMQPEALDPHDLGFKLQPAANVERQKRNQRAKQRQAGRADRDAADRPPLAAGHKPNGRSSKQRQQNNDQQPIHFPINSK